MASQKGSQRLNEKKPSLGAIRFHLGFPCSLGFPLAGDGESLET